MRYILLLAVIGTVGFTTLVSVPNFGFPLNGLSQGAVSSMYATTITPAAYAFSIWSLIYTTWIILGVAVAVKSISLSDRLVRVFWSAIVLSALWLIPFHYLYQWVALLVMLIILLLCLWSVELARSGSLGVRYVTELYLGWITVATTANVAIVAVATPMLASISIFGGNIWALIGLGIATLAHTLIALRYRAYIPGCVLIWALIANMVAHTDELQRAGVSIYIVWMLGVLGYVSYISTNKKTLPN